MCSSAIAVMASSRLHLWKQISKHRSQSTHRVLCQAVVSRGAVVARGVVLDRASAHNLWCSKQGGSGSEGQRGAGAGGATCRWGGCSCLSDETPSDNCSTTLCHHEAAGVVGSCTNGWGQDGQTVCRHSPGGRRGGQRWCGCCARSERRGRLCRWGRWQPSLCVCVRSEQASEGQTCGGLRELRSRVKIELILQNAR